MGISCNVGVTPNSRFYFSAGVSFIHCNFDYGLVWVMVVMRYPSANPYHPRHQTYYYFGLHSFHPFWLVQKSDPFLVIFPFLS